MLPILLRPNQRLMAREITIYSLYKLTASDHSEEYLLLRTEQPSYSNANQSQENAGLNIETKKRQLLLKSYINHKKRNPEIEFIGELQLPPFGDKLYADKGNFRLIVCYQQTEFGKPWIILGNTNTISDFQKELADDNDMLSLKPIGPVEKIEAMFITENDFDLSSIENYDTRDMRDL